MTTFAEMSVCREVLGQMLDGTPFNVMDEVDAGRIEDDVIMHAMFYGKVPVAGASFPAFARQRMLDVAADLREAADQLETKARGA